MNQMLPQPPPNAPLPPPSEQALRSQKWWRWILGVGIASIILLVLGGLTAPLVFRSRKKADQVEAVSNARQIGIALIEFDQTYGRYPDDSTAKLVQATKPTSLKLGSSTSNDYFRQLLAAEITNAEFMFYAKTQFSKKPDGIVSGSDALKKGEVAFAYIAGFSSATAHPQTPLVVTPLVPGKRIFDIKWCKKYFHGKAVILFADSSVRSYPVDPSGRVWIDGKDLFDPSQPFWGGKVPDVKWPE
jgi:type II secretory pathway pseudopilin PulG